MHDNGSLGLELDTQDQGCPNLFLEGQCPVEFNFNISLTHLDQLIKLFRLTKNVQAGACTAVL